MWIKVVSHLIDYSRVPLCKYKEILARRGVSALFRRFSLGMHPFWCKLNFNIPSQLLNNQLFSHWFTNYWNSNQKKESSIQSNDLKMTCLSLIIYQLYSKIGLTLKTGPTFKSWINFIKVFFFKCSFSSSFLKFDGADFQLCFLQLKFSRKKRWTKIQRMALPARKK